MGRDPNLKWVHWLARSRRDNPGSMFDTLSSSSFPSSLYKESSIVGNSKSVRSRSSATNYFTLLSANEDGSSDGRQFANHKQHGNIPGLTTRDIDYSWVARFAEHQHQQADMPRNMVQEKAHSSEQSFLNINKTLPPTERQRLQMRKNSLPQDPENAVVSNITTTTASAFSSSLGTTSPLPSPLNNLWDFDVDSLGSDYLCNIRSPLPFDPTDTQANGAAGPCATTGLDNEDLSWLDKRHPFPLYTNDEPEKSSPTRKRRREEYPGDYADDGQTHLEDVTKRNQRIFHPWTDRHESSSPFAFSLTTQPVATHHPGK